MDILNVFLIGALVAFILESADCTCTKPKGWHLDRIDQESGLDSCYNGNISAHVKPVLYVIDSGIYKEHNEFNSRDVDVIDGYNFLDNSWDGNDCSGHGTHVAALAAGKNFGVAGGIPVDIVSVRILDCQGRGTCSAMIKAMEWVYQNHTKTRAGVPGVVVMSVGSSQGECQSADIAAEALMAQNILVVAAAGNSNVDACKVHPASSRNTIAVSALGLDDTTNKDHMWSKTNYGKTTLALVLSLLARQAFNILFFSQRLLVSVRSECRGRMKVDKASYADIFAFLFSVLGPAGSCVDIHAPGVDITSAGVTSPDAEKILSGTSMAAPQVAGQSLLVMASFPQLDVHAVREVILTSGTNGTLPEDERMRSPRALIALVPYQRMKETANARGDLESDADEFADPSFDGDIVVFDVKTASRTNPPMQYVANQVAEGLTTHFKSSGDTISTVCQRITSGQNVLLSLEMRCFVKTIPGKAESVVASTSKAVATVREPGGGQVFLTTQPRVVQRTTQKHFATTGIAVGVSIGVVILIVVGGVLFYAYRTNERQEL